MRIILTLFSLFSMVSYGATSPETQKYLVNLLKANDSVHSAFVKNDEQGVKPVWANFEKVLSGSAPNELKEFVSESKVATVKLVSASAFDEKRKLYGDVIKPIVAMLQKFGPIDSYKVFTCPMVKKDWIQDTKLNSEVQNPYDPKMVKCGMMRE
ncbi:MAG: hypothetical protein A2X86_06205 [Bdellovibrionales bacterium GWA2_49_15]|nr:MAG: hypothetical protein A2X86_06205 [Bdellovibrionales bacterium GWA2_49_15]